MSRQSLRVSKDDHSRTASVAGMSGMTITDVSCRDGDVFEGRSKAPLRHAVSLPTSFTASCRPADPQAAARHHRVSSNGVLRPTLSKTSMASISEEEVLTILESMGDSDILSAMPPCDCDECLLQEPDMVNGEKKKPLKRLDTGLWVEVEGALGGCVWWGLKSSDVCGCDDLVAVCGGAQVIGRVWV
ncbi:hypothetical protein Btru_042905 [Bulinus truncatus]|nr:hypothetical protein Btru_042905 [Bulinus truncatus]